MERKFEEELDQLKQELLSVGAQVERNVGDALQSLITRDPDLARQVISRDPAVDYSEIHIDEVCLSILARRQPVARDLRFIATSFKIVKDLERIGDMSKDISEHALEILRQPPVRDFTDLQPLTAFALSMLKRALDAFVNRDPVLARQVIADDDKVDDMHAELWTEIVDAMKAEPNWIAPLAHLFSIAKYIERIGDHSSNVAEMVVFMVEGKDIRHYEKVRALREAKERS
ncbi:MAG: phosphate signaling complex protein PhoU [Acidobacteria bacterium]|nr:MAG: phosphate signaling complex protein PhoU [Acidobacteriota bacterium]